MNFRKVTLRFSRQNCDKSAYVHMEEHLCILWSYFPWDACSTNVQHGNKVKTYPKRPFCITFMLKKPCLKVQILQYKFLDWKWPPPFWNFSENSSDLLTLPVPNWCLLVSLHRQLSCSGKYFHHHKSGLSKCPICLICCKCPNVQCSNEHFYVF